MAEVETTSCDDVLRRAAQDGSMDYAVWPDLLPVLLARIENIARTEFPIPNIPSPHPPARPPSPRFLAPLPSSDPFDTSDQAEPSPSSQGTDKENAHPSSPSASRHAAPSTSASAGGPSSQPSAPAPLPKPIADMLDEILAVLRSNFSQYPPHTIQRLAELVLQPRQHYRNVVPYLHALDRVVHVTSGANTYPLPPALPDIGAMSLLANGAGGGAAGNLSVDTLAANSLGSDEALGGALLTPIPWLARSANGGSSDDGSDVDSSSPLSAGGNPAQQFHLQQQARGAHLEGRVQTESTETIEGPNGIGSIETVSVSVNGIPSTGAGAALLGQRSVTQGELLRQEQRAGLVPRNQINRQQQQQQQQRHAAESGTSGDADDDAVMSENVPQEEDEIPHARGPEVIGLADTGPLSAAAASYIASGGSGGGGGPKNLQGMDVEVAVGQRLQSPPAQQQPQQETNKRTSSSPDIVPRSPKREATGNLEQESPRKRLKEEEPASSASNGGGQDQNQGLAQLATSPPSSDTRSTTTITATPATHGAQAGAPAKPDAEGDVTLPDAQQQPEPPAPDPSTGEATTQGGDGGNDGDETTSTTTTTAPVKGAEAADKADGEGESTAEQDTAGATTTTKTSG
ncbi:78e3a5b7-3e2f-41dc-8460-ad460520e64e [Thermothielavioides terrestris]|uniref:78e3a5b7-3e2f-41dc-8460-ad460520e64e n=1 Tax=Thermothielavioides terrestris TaxID=2587410 RepID=A0A446B5K5_9PEZI|nr:78e3a5b7-3e2f-41dc-8460-ad460520e64e [Thermothielavioides terrestris]